MSPSEAGPLKNIYQIWPFNRIKRLVAVQVGQGQILSSLVPKLRNDLSLAEVPLHCNQVGLYLSTLSLNRLGDNSCLNVGARGATHKKPSFNADSILWSSTNNGIYCLMMPQICLYSRLYDVENTSVFFWLLTDGVLCLSNSKLLVSLVRAFSCAWLNSWVTYGSRHRTSLSAHKGRRLQL